MTQCCASSPIYCELNRCNQECPKPSYIIGKADNKKHCDENVVQIISESVTALVLTGITAINVDAEHTIQIETANLKTFCYSFVRFIPAPYSVHVDY